MAKKWLTSVPIKIALSQMVKIISLEQSHLIGWRKPVHVPLF
jgi:hypothetical protein